MKLVTGLCLTIVTLVVAVSPSMAVMTNKGVDLPLIPCPNQLTPDDGRDVGRILYAPSEVDDPAYRAAIAAITGGIVDYYDARVGTPSVALMATYDCVHTWPDYAYLDQEAFGDNLAAYVDGGGKVVLGAFCTYCYGYPLGGRIMTPAYCPVVSPTCSNHFMSSAYAHDGVSFIYDGVVSFDCVYRDYLVTQGGGVVDGHYEDGEIAHAYSPDHRVIYSNGGGAALLYGGGDWPRLIANACGCEVIPGMSGACCLPSGSCTYAQAVICADFMHGLWRPCVTCAAADCPDAEACCFPDGACEMLAEFGCNQQGGQAQGAGTHCDPNPCVPVPVGKLNWGRMKALYH
jgi:hypothetical protein